MKQFILFASLFSLCIISSCKKHSASSGNSGCRTYAGSKEGNRYSSNEEITLKNVVELKLDWTYSTNDKDSANRSQNQCNPIMVDGILYGTSPKLKLFALDAATGTQKWLFDPALLDTSKKKDAMAYYKVCRGVTYWEDQNGDNKRLFYSVGQKTFAI